MPVAELKYFQQLKKDVSKKARKSFPENNEDIEQWKGKEISNFQSDLIAKANGRISEKWFYTHIKSTQKSIPRIDILNLLSQYVGHEDWEGYVASTQVKKTPSALVTKYGKVIIIVFILLTASGLLTLFMTKYNTYQFCFVNAYSKKALKSHNIDILILNNHESPYKIKSVKHGCFKVKIKSDYIKFVVSSPYYKTDTITRIFNKSIDNEVIALQTNDYAWMIHLFSKSKVKDWKARRSQLGQMLAANARIYQIFDDINTGMEMYNKEEFINKLTIPATSLKDIEVLETVYQDGKIAVLRFIQKKQGSGE